MTKVARLMGIILLLLPAALATAQDARNVRKVGAYETPGFVEGVFVLGSYSRVGDVGAGLQVIDVSDPRKPVEVGYYDKPGLGAEDVFVSGRYAYMADGDAGLRVIDVSNPARPTEVGYYDTPGYTSALFVSGGYAYVADHDNGPGVRGLRVIDVSNPRKPIEVGFLDAGDGSDVFVSGRYAYVVGALGLGVIDISNPKNPKVVGVCHITLLAARGVFISGRYAYVAARSEGLRVIDVSDPTCPRPVGHCITPYEAVQVFVSGSFAYVVAAEGGLRVIDVSNPSEPREVGYYNANQFKGHGIFVFGRYVYAATQHGLLILRFAGTSTTNQPPSAPAPTSSADNATVSFNPTCTLKVADPSGDWVKFVFEVS